MTTRAELFKNLEYEIQFMAKTTQQQYRSKVAGYLDWLIEKKGNIDLWQDRDTLYKYVAHLKSTGLSQQTINFALRGGIATLFKMQQPSLRLPVKMPKVSRGMHDLNTLKHFTDAEIANLIKTARQSGNPQWQNLMALTSIYGLRAGEVRLVGKEDVYPVKKTLVIHTEKGGLLREHIVPAVIAPYIFKYDYPKLADKKVHDIFGRIADAASVAHDDRKNIHAVRHAVVTALSNLRNANDQLVFQAPDVFRFMRWAGGTMLESYNHPQLLENDERIFKNHPFLKYWQ